TLSLIWGLFAMSLNLQVGYAGLQSLGHAAFFGTAAYTVGILSRKAGITDFWVDVLVALVLGTLVAAILGVLALRATGPYYLMSTLALAQVLWGLAYGKRDWTGGDDGLPGITRPDFGLVSLVPGSNYFLFVLGVFVLATLAMSVLVRSPFGSSLQGIRESESRMRMLGYNTWLFKYLCFVLSGFLAAVAGVLNAYYLQFVSVGDLSVVLSAEALLMVILGGPGTLLGPALGAVVLVFLRNIVSGQHVAIGPFDVGERWTLVLGVVYILVVMFAPRGIVGEVLERARGRRAAGRLVTLAAEEPPEMVEVPVEPQAAVGTHGAAGR
ncbi:MAG TPA: branched-chain amino acid ABC transporter permease, partial [Chloroflexota bacterium]|nr:branched-chain amino acid ABC transporter permease [Chloroflexota bacterium]